MSIQGNILNLSNPTGSTATYTKYGIFYGGIVSGTDLCPAASTPVPIAVIDNTSSIVLDGSGLFANFTEVGTYKVEIRVELDNPCVVPCNIRVDFGFVRLGLFFEIGDRIQNGSTVIQVPAPFLPLPLQYLASVTLPNIAAPELIVSGPNFQSYVIVQRIA